MSISADKEKVRAAILDRHAGEKIRITWLETVETEFDIGNVYYAEYDYVEEEDASKTKERAGNIAKTAAEDGDDEDDVDEDADDEDDEADEWESFYYAVVRNGEVILYDDSIHVIQALNIFLQQKKTFWQRLSNFTLVDAVGAIIALLVTGAFVVAFFLPHSKNDDSQQMFQQLTSIFAVIIGYYFGRVSSSAGNKDSN